MQRLIESTASEAAFDISADGKKMVFLSNRSGNMDVWLKELGSGREGPLTATPLDEWWPQMTPDGSRVSYEVREGNDRPIIYVLPADGGVGERVCEDCGGPWDWSPDGQSFLYRIPDPLGRIGLFDLQARKKSEPLKHRQYDLLGPVFSPDGHWIALLAWDRLRWAHRLGSDRPHQGHGLFVFVVPFRAGKAPAESEWIPVVEGTSETFFEWVEWSADGNILYFLSSRDGSVCLWAQRLGASKRPVGSAFSVYHFHQIRLSLTNSDINSPPYLLSRDRVVFNLGELTGNIWMTTLKSDK